VGEVVSGWLLAGNFSRSMLYYVPFSLLGFDGLFARARAGC